MTYPQDYQQVSTESPRSKLRTRVPSESDLRGRERGPAKDPLPRSSALPPVPKDRPVEATAPGEGRTSLRTESDGSSLIESQVCGSTAHLGDELGLSPESKSERAGFDSSVAREKTPTTASAPSSGETEPEGGEGGGVLVPADTREVELESSLSRSRLVRGYWRKIPALYDYLDRLTDDSYSDPNPGVWNYDVEADEWTLIGGSK